MEQLRKLAEKIDNLSLRERAIVFIGIIAVIFTFWDTFLMRPLEIEQKKLVADLNKKNADRLVLNTRFQKLIKTEKQDPNAENLTRLQNLRSRLIDVQAELETSTDSLISPDEMPKILETVLHRTDGLTLTGLKSLGAKPLIETTEDDGIKDTSKKETPDTDKKLTAENIDNAYRHGLRIEITGDYLTTLDYLRSLEELEWGFFWDNFQLSVNEYPENNTSIEIFTLSLNKEWIGV